MSQLKNKITEIYLKHRELSEEVEKRNSKLKDREALSKEFMKSLEDEKGAEDLTTYYKDTILLSHQMRVQFENLMNLISIAFEIGEELEEDVKNYYNEYKVYKFKPLFVLEAGVLTPTDEELVKTQRDFLNDEFLKKQISSS